MTDLDLFTPHDAKEQGNRFFKGGQLDKAIQSYTTCIELFKKECSVQALLEVEYVYMRTMYLKILLQADKREVLLAVLLNRALAFTKIGKFQEGIWDCSEALSLDPKNVKALFRRANAYMSVKRHCRAVDDLDKVLNSEPGHPQAIRLKNEALEKEAIAKETLEKRAKNEARDPKPVVFQPSPKVMADAKRATGNAAPGNAATHDITQLASLLAPAPIPSEVACTQQSEITDIRPIVKKPTKISIEEVVSEEAKQSGTFTVTKEIAERYRTAKPKEAPRPAGAKENVKLEQYHLNFSHLTDVSENLNLGLPTTAAEACLAVKRPEDTRDSNNNDIDAGWQDLDGSYSATKVRMGCDRKHEGVDKLVMKLQAQAEAMGDDERADGKGTKRKGIASRRYRSKIQLRRASDRLSNEAEQMWAHLEKEEVRTQEHIHERLSVKLQQEATGLSKRRQMQETKKQNKALQQDKVKERNCAAQDSDGEYSSDDEGRFNSRNFGSGCWMDALTAPDMAASRSDDGSSSDDEDGWEKVESPRKQGLVASCARVRSSGFNDSLDDKHINTKDAEWQSLLQEELIKKKEVAMRKQLKKAKEEEGLKRREEKLLQRDKDVDAGPRHCLVAMPDLSGFTETQKKMGLTDKACESNPLDTAGLSCMKGRKKKKTKKACKSGADPMLVTHLAAPLEGSSKKKRSKAGKVKVRAKSSKVPATAFALEKVWVRQYRQQPALFHDLLFSGNMDESTMRAVFSSLNEPNIVSEVIVGIDKYLSRCNVVGNGTGIVQTSMLLLESLTASSRFMTTIMMLGPSDKQAIDRIFTKLAEHDNVTDLGKLLSKYE